ncbi:beta-1,6-N-acetylglucosaminyltransferase [Shewanella sp. 4_MG-2023]|uniref:beta-1,6-N-acetylglucosaminyltransferase n=1 Tax=Shewanella sp. 4_MG-2023 TaxID=3062652 RepID=UPI0026E133CD|nr:beta-1,6-N-acetylglucosaminyltransferase [Shewanella sp. 4_MG-2023]MDO6678456.1 beta-1,6-N-acetylglucosaminyltransferase [Shewanella sp. 4_MG-2023]
MENIFLIQVHKDTEQLRLLIKILSDVCDICIHVDKKHDCAFKSLSLFVNSCDFIHKVQFTDERVNVFWGHVSQVKATFSLLKSAKKMNSYNFYTLLSGECFPIKPLTDFLLFLSNSHGKNFIEAKKNICTSRVNNYHLFVDTSIYRSSPVFRFVIGSLGKSLSFIGVNSRFSSFVNIYKGSSWFTLNNNFVNLLISSESDLDKLKYSKCVDEIYFQSKLINSDLSGTWVNNNLRTINWVQGSNSPLFISDVDDLINTSDFFARKFDFRKNVSLRDELLKLIQENKAI